MIHMRIDNLKRSDAPQLADIWNSCFPDASLSASSLREQIYSIFKLDEKGVFCIREGADIEGFAVATDILIPFAAGSPLTGCIPVIALKEKARQRGAGSALLEKAEEYLSGRGAERIRIGYPAYLRGTILSHIGVGINTPGAVYFFEKHGYAPVKAIDSMVFDAAGSEIPEGYPDKIEPDVTFEALSPPEAADFLVFIEQEFPGSWSEQFRRLYKLNLLDCSEVLIMKCSGKISGFAGPFHIAECGDTCGIGLGIAADLRGKGLGLALLHGILRFIMKNGGRKITLFGAVDKINYYGKAGFSPGPVYLVMEKEV